MVYLWNSLYLSDDGFAEDHGDVDPEVGGGHQQVGLLQQHRSHKGHKERREGEGGAATYTNTLVRKCMCVLFKRKMSLFKLS